MSVHILLLTTLSLFIEENYPKVFETFAFWSNHLLLHWSVMVITACGCFHTVPAIKYKTVSNM